MASLHADSFPHKGNEVATEENVPASDGLDEPVDANMEKLGTSHDRRDMRRMGKMQELRVS